MTPSRSGPESTIALPRGMYFPPESGQYCVALTRASVGSVIPKFAPSLQGADVLKMKSEYFPPLNVYMRTFDGVTLDSTRLAVSVIKYMPPPSEKENMETHYLVKLQPVTAEEGAPIPSLRGVQFYLRSELPLRMIETLSTEINFQGKFGTLLEVRASLLDQRSCSKNIRYGVSVVRLPTVKRESDFALKGFKPALELVARTAIKEPHPLLLASERRHSRASFVTKFSGEITEEDRVYKTGLKFLKSGGALKRVLTKTQSEGSAATWGASDKKEAKARRSTLKRVGDDTEDSGWVLVHGLATTK